MGPSPAPRHLVPPKVCKGGLSISTQVNLWERGVNRGNVRNGKGKSDVEQNATLDVWTKYGADQHKVCLWYLGSKIQASNSCSQCEIIPNPHWEPLARRSAVGCMALWGTARRRKAFCSLGESECPMLDHVLTQIL